MQKSLTPLAPATELCMVTPKICGSSVQLLPLPNSLPRILRCLPKFRKICSYLSYFITINYCFEEPINLQSGQQAKIKKINFPKTSQKSITSPCVISHNSAPLSYFAAKSEITHESGQLLLEPTCPVYVIGKVNPTTGYETPEREQSYSDSFPLSSALDGGGCSKAWYPLYRRLGGTQGRSGWVWKISPPSGFDPQRSSL
jgi:hypothetical protein